MKKLIALFALLIISLSVCSCNNQETPEEYKEEYKEESWSEELITNDPEGVSYEYFFESVADLRDAIKHEPDKYNGAKIKIVGTVDLYYASHDYNFSDKLTRLVDITVNTTNTPIRETTVTGEDIRSLKEFFTKLDNASGIKVNISNDAQFYVTSDGDYVKLYGTIRIERDALYIDNCEYDLIATVDERVENLNQQ